MGRPVDNIKKFILFSIVFHVLISFAWGKIVVQKSVPVYGDHIEVSLRHFEFKKPEPAKKVVRKKKVVKKKKEKVVKKVKKRDDSLALKKKAEPAPEELSEEAYASTARPSYGFTPRPPYPAVAIRRGYEGSVLLNVHVLPNGKPEEVTIFRSSGHKVLDNAALKAVKKWKFVPAQRGFKAVSSWVKVPIEFRLE